MSGTLQSRYKRPARRGRQLAFEAVPTEQTAFAALPDATGGETAAVTQVLALYGHALDTNEPALLAQVFVDPPAVASTESPSHHTGNTQVKKISQGLAGWSRLADRRPPGQPRQPPRRRSRRALGPDPDRGHLAGTLTTLEAPTTMPAAIMAMPAAITTMPAAPAAMRPGRSARAVIRVRSFRRFT